MIFSGIAMPKIEVGVKMFWLGGLGGSSSELCRFFFGVDLGNVPKILYLLFFFFFK